MPKYIEVKGNVIEFPDGMSNADIESAIKANMMALKPATAPQSSPPYDPTQDMGTGQRLAAGMGKAIVDLGRGAGQMLGLIDQKSIDEAKQLDAPLARTGAGKAGIIAGNILPAAMTAMIPGANTLTGSALTGAALNALQPLDAGQSRLKEAAIGAGLGAAGQGVANTVGRIVKPVQAAQTGADAELVRKAKAMGLQLNAAQETGSKPLRWIDSALDNLPYTAERQAAAKQGQRAVWQRKVMEQLGEQADTAAPEVLGAAYTRLGGQFRDLSARNVVDLGDPFLDAIARIDASRTPFSKGVEDVVNKALDLASRGRISGKDYQAVRTSLTNASKGAWQQNPELGQALKSLRNALDDAAEASISPADKAAWKSVREQYKALKTVEKAADATTGTISPKKLVNELGRQNPQGMRYGFGNQDLPDLARVGKQFIAENLPDSGTAQRSWYMNALQNPTAGLGGLLGFTAGGPMGALAGLAAGAATPLAAQKALWSNGRYLRDGLMNPDMARLLTRPVAIGAPVGLLSVLPE